MQWQSQQIKGRYLILMSKFKSDWLHCMCCRKFGVHILIFDLLIKKHILLCQFWKASKSKQDRNGFQLHMLRNKFHVWLMIAWLFPDYSLKTARLLTDDFLIITCNWYLPDNCLTAARWLSDDCLMTVCKSHSEIACLLIDDFALN